MELTPGAIYLLRGGHIVRYLGEGQPPFIALSDVCRRVTNEDARFLRVRFFQLIRRGLIEEAGWIREVMQEVGVSLHGYVAQLTAALIQGRRNA